MIAQDVRIKMAVNDHNGIYCASVFLERYESNLCCAGSKDEICTDPRIEEAVAFVKDPKNIYADGYWDEWDYVTAHVKVYSEIQNGADVEYWSIYHNGDVWLLNDADYNELDDKQQDLFWEQYSYLC